MSMQKATIRRLRTPNSASERIAGAAIDAAPLTPG
jgi:hypothetical protein